MNTKEKLEKLSFLLTKLRESEMNLRTIMGLQRGNHLTRERLVTETRFALRAAIGEVEDLRKEAEGRHRGVEKRKGNGGRDGAA